VEAVYPNTAMANESNKESREKVCVQCFLEWYNRQHETNYTVERAEKFFPELAHQTSVVSPLYLDNMPVV
jgi:hypothetical protein